MFALLIALIGVSIIGVIVFGGGQVFMPLFKSLWELMGNHGVNIKGSDINSIFTIANSTPGVISTKFALITGYLTANGAWWGWLALLLTYLFFSLPAIFLMAFAIKIVSKSQTSKHFKNVVTFLKPVISGIVIALAIQLFIGTAFPNLVFNSTSDYVGTKTSLFSGWRLYTLIAYSVVVMFESAYLYIKKFNIFYLIVIHIILGFIIFQPWLM